MRGKRDKGKLEIGEKEEVEGKNEVFWGRKR